MTDLTSLSSYDYPLPPERIAQQPLSDRSASKLLVVCRDTGRISHHIFRDLPGLLKAGDLLVMNRSKVIPARLIGNKPSGGQVEVFLLKHETGHVWQCLVKPGRRMRPGTEVVFGEGLTARIIAEADEGSRLVEFFPDGEFFACIDRLGHMPLPPYIHRDAVESDKTTYQTVYSREPGSVAAPTAGLHFTPELLDSLRAGGIATAEVILHVGLGTFRPVQCENITQHVLHSEHCVVPAETALSVNNTKTGCGRVIAVGTTSTRTMESFAQNGVLSAGEMWSDLFLYPGRTAQIVDGLITNFHLPKSSLLMLVATIMGYDLMREAYRQALENDYRFLSYGDAMLII